MLLSHFCIIYGLVALVMVIGSWRSRGRWFDFWSFSTIIVLYCVSWPGRLSSPSWIVPRRLQPTSTMSTVVMCGSQNLQRAGNGQR